VHLLSTAVSRLPAPMSSLATARRMSWKALSVLLLAGAIVPLAPCRAQSFSNTEVLYHSLVPLGAEAFQLHPAHRTLYLMGSARSPDFEGWKAIEQHGRNQTVLDAAGSPVRYFPETVQFRVTASALREGMLEVPTFPLDAAGDLNEYLLRLSFRVKIFHGLKVRLVEPDAVEMIGMPAEIPYDERVYGASFTLGRVPLEDRIVLEVLDPGGERICKFHLEF
jgi:hypothetical protein